jgi:nucleotide-binding universal stress UspA family protein
MKKILVPVDFNPLATAALRHAAQLAQQDGATLIVMYADTFEPPAEFTATQTSSLAASIDDSRRRTAEELERYAHENVAETIAMQTEVREALPVEGILAAIEEHQPDLVVMGTHGRGALSRLMFGSVARAVLRATNVPVVTIDKA